MIKELPGGLILRTLSEGYAGDSAQLPQFYADINGEGESEEAKHWLYVWTQDLIERHPTTTLDDIFVVVDPAHDDRIASATLLIPQTWRYEEIPLAVGRPELVGTHPEYRSRGLVRALFEAVHQRSADLGHQLQVITGIPHFYRQFGYTMAVDLGSHAMFPLQMMQEPATEYTPAFTLRPATQADLSQVAAWYDYMARERLLTQLRSTEEWRYEMAGHHVESMQRMDYLIIVNAAGEGVGYLEFFANRQHKHLLVCTAYVVGDQASYLETFDDVMQGVRQWSVAKHGECPALLAFDAGLHDSVDQMIDRTLGGVLRRRVYQWYVRVPDLIPFLCQIQPVLERRLEGSGAHRYTGEFKIGFYDLSGVALKFERGRITEISAIKGKDGYDISFPWNLFWNVLFGQHTYNDLGAILPEVWAGSRGKGAVLLDALFPKKKSWLKGLS